ncbi:hypothetical protein RchiOBHm_Chr1g0366611 [Rosa chinensis]|uniref:Uncharacterized protein n=1 Tax=Rosa chinensis TaxID=74649 RepID=A0A2P6SK98_ROSCH|nr:hypothetical protein RchiOBHm_Chr1g0366611 [Rosa chinensis]
MILIRGRQRAGPGRALLKIKGSKPVHIKRALRAFSGRAGLGLAGFFGPGLAGFIYK